MFSRAREETNQTLIYHNYFYPTKTGLCLPLKHTLITPLNSCKVCFIFIAFNSTAEAVMAFVMAMSDVIYDQNPNIWFLDASAAIFIGFVLFVYGIR